MYRVRHLPTGAYIHASNGGYKLLSSKEGAALFTEEKALSLIDDLTLQLPGDFEKDEESKTKK